MGKDENEKDGKVGGTRREVEKGNRNGFSDHKENKKIAIVVITFPQASKMSSFGP